MALESLRKKFLGSIPNWHEVTLEYLIPQGELEFDNLVDLTVKLKDARDAVRKDLNGVVQVSVCKDQTLSQDHYTVQFKAKDPTMYKQALETFIDHAGLPQYSPSGSDYDVLGKVVESKGAKLRAPLNLRLFPGRLIVTNTIDEFD